MDNNALTINTQDLILGEEMYILSNIDQSDGWYSRRLDFISIITDIEGLKLALIEQANIYGYEAILNEPVKIKKLQNGFYSISISVLEQDEKIEHTSFLAPIPKASVALKEKELRFTTI